MTPQVAETQSALRSAPLDLLALFNYSPLAQLLIKADDPVFTLVAANDAYLAMVGLTRDELLGRSVFEVFTDSPGNDSANGSRNLLATLRKTIATRVPQRPPIHRYDLARPAAEGGGFEERYWNSQSTAIPGEDGSVAYILHSVEEVTAQVLASRNQQATEKRFQQLAEVCELGIMIGDHEGGIWYANPALLRLLGYTDADVAAGLLRWDEITPPDCKALDEQAKQQAMICGKCTPYEKVYLSKSGKRVPVLVGAARLEPVNGRTDVAAFVLDLTERKQSQRDSFLVHLNDATRQLEDPDDIVRVVAQLLCEHLAADRCSYGILTADQDTFEVLSEYYSSATKSIKGRYSLSKLGAGLKPCLLSNQPYVVNDTQTDPRLAETRRAGMPSGIRATIAIPLHKGGRLVAAMGVSDCKRARVWLPEEVALVSTVVNRCWESIERARLARQLQLSEERLRLAQRSARIGTFEWHIKEDRLFWTEELEALYGLPEIGAERTVDHWRQCVVKQDAERVLSSIQACIDRKDTEFSYEFRAVLPDGTQRWLRGRSSVFYNESGVAERMVGVNIDIDAQVKAQAAGEESERRLRAIYDGTYEYMGLLSPDGTVLEANRAALEFGGNTLDEIRGKPAWETPWFAGTPGAKDIVRQAVERAATGEFVRFEATLRRPSGDPLTFDISLHPIKNEDGAVILIVPEGRDITERKLAEERLRQQWLTFDTVLSNSPDLTYSFDVEGRFTYANKKLCQVSQRPLKDTVGRTPLELGYPPDLAERIKNQIRQVIETRSGVRDETAFRLRTGEVREYEYLYEPVIGESGEVEAIAGATRDVTERKEAEEQLRRSERQFRELFDSLPQLVWSSLPDGSDDLHNNQWFQYTGLSEEQVRGDGSQIIHPDDLPATLEKWTRSLETGEPYEVEYRLRRFDGQYRWFIGRARPVRDDQNRLVRWFGTCTDIHDKKESETALLKAHRQMEEFSYVASHDLQEPLRMVNIYSQLMLREIGTDDGKIGQYASFVRQGVQRAETLIRDLLTFSRVVQSEPQKENEPADLAAALAEAKAVLCTRIEETAASITAGPLPTVAGDTAQMAHVFQNLISNSLKYRKADPPDIRINATLENGIWIVSVTDNGIGFEPKYAERIFGLFKRLHKDEYPGTGLGLSICQRIVERYGGRMWAEGRPGTGATFYFTLPAAD